MDEPAPGRPDKRPISTQEALDALYDRTTFATEEGKIEWDGLRRLGRDQYRVLQGSYFGGTLITMADTYENGGNDAAFLQELLRLFREKRLRVVKPV